MDEQRVQIEVLDIGIYKLYILIEKLLLSSTELDIRKEERRF